MRSARAWCVVAWLAGSPSVTAIGSGRADSGLSAAGDLDRLAGRLARLLPPESDTVAITNPDRGSGDLAGARLAGVRVDLVNPKPAAGTATAGDRQPGRPVGQPAGRAGSVRASPVETPVGSTRICAVFGGSGGDLELITEIREVGAVAPTQRKTTAQDRQQAVRRVLRDQDTVPF